MIRVGLVDTGIAPALAGSVAAAQAFTGAALTEDALGHGTTVAGIILHHAPDARLLNAQAFGSGSRAEAAAVADALRWLIAERARIVNLSLGLPHDREVLRDGGRRGARRRPDPDRRDAGPGRAGLPRRLSGRAAGDRRCPLRAGRALGARRRAGRLWRLSARPRRDPGRRLARCGARHRPARPGPQSAGTDPIAVLSRAVRFYGRERRQP